MSRSLLHIAALLLAAGLAGCQQYYKVSEPNGNKVYYTDHISEAEGGSIKFKDLQTGDRVTLQSSVVTDIRKDDLPAGVKNSK